MGLIEYLKEVLHMSMKCVTVIAMVLAPFFLLAQESREKSDTIVLHPGDIFYARFQRDGGSLTLAGVNKEADKAAQVILKMGPLKEIHGTMLQVENKFDRNLYYKAEIHLLSKNKRLNTSVMPVIAGKLSFESWPNVIEELVLSGFELRDN